jgi:hypothetical protein
MCSAKAVFPGNREIGRGMRDLKDKELESQSRRKRKSKDKLKYNSTQHISEIWPCLPLCKTRQEF